jgi:hypothetical protein
MKAVFTHSCKLALLLSATLSLNAWSADAVQVTPVKSNSIVLTNLDLGVPDTAGNTAAPKDAKAQIPADRNSPADAAPAANVEAEKLAPVLREEGAGTSFPNVGLPGAVSAADLEQQGSPANYRELVLKNAQANRYANPNAMRRYLAVDRATYQARIGQ